MIVEVWKNEFSGAWQARGNVEGRRFTVSSFSTRLLKWKFRRRAGRMSAQIAKGRRIEEQLR